MKNNKAFTLLELLATIIILGVVLMIAVPSVTRVTTSSKERQLEKDAEMFVSLVQAKIVKDTSIEIPPDNKGCFMIESVDSKSLTGDYDRKSYVKASNCEYNEERYSCQNYETLLVYKDNSKGYQNGAFIQPPIDLIDVCAGSEWCLCS